jgi:hypothetical protein
MTRRKDGAGLATPVFLWMLMAALGAAGPAAGQIKTDTRVWTAVSVQGRTGADSPWHWVSDSLLRTRDGAGTLDFLAERVMMTRDLTPRASAGIGYAFGAGFPDAGSLREHRFVQQVAWGLGGSPRVSLKSRIEERFVTGYPAMRLRLRQQVRVTWPLTMTRGLQGIVSDEVFLQLNSTARAPRGFESNRFFVGVGRRLTGRSVLEIGYMNVYSRGGAGLHQDSHILSATWVLSLSEPGRRKGDSTGRVQ